MAADRSPARVAVVTGRARAASAPCGSRALRGRRARRSSGIDLAASADGVERRRRDRPRRAATPRCARIERRARRAVRARQQRRHRPAARTPAAGAAEDVPLDGVPRTLDVNLAGHVQRDPGRSAPRWSPRAAARSSTSARCTPSIAPEPRFYDHLRRPAVPQARRPTAPRRPAWSADALLRPPLGPARRARQRAVARRRARRPGRRVPGQVLRPRAARPDGRARPTSAARCCSSPRTRRATSRGTSCASTEASPHEHARGDDGRSATSSPARSGRRRRARRSRSSRPATGELLVARRALGRARTSTRAIAAAAAAQPAWARETPAARGALLRRIAQLLERDADEIAAIVAAETGKSPKDALGETGGAIEMGYFVAGEGRRLYGKTTTSRGAQPPGHDRAPAARRRGADHRRQHADRQRRLEGLPGADVRQRRRAEGDRGHAGDRAGVRAAGRRGGPARRACSTSSRASARRPGSRSSRTRASRVVSFTGSTAVGPHDRPRGRRAAGQGLPRARRQEPARRLRRRRPRAGAPTPRRCRRTPTPASAARRAAGSSSSTRVYDEFKALLLRAHERAARRARATSTTSAR